MPKFRVIIKYITHASYTVEAADEGDAYDKAHGLNADEKVRNVYLDNLEYDHTSYEALEECEEGL